MNFQQQKKHSRITKIYYGGKYESSVGRFTEGGVQHETFTVQIGVEGRRDLGHVLPVESGQVDAERIFWPLTFVVHSRSGHVVFLVRRIQVLTWIHENLKFKVEIEFSIRFSDLDLVENEWLLEVVIFENNQVTSH